MGLPGKMSNLRLMDYHMHTGVTIDGRMDEFSACRKALSLGIQEIAFTNHIMLNQPDYQVSPPAFCNHWENIQACQKRFPGLQIRLGIEMDYYINREEEVSRTIESYEALIGRKFDLVLGAVHEIKGFFFSNKRKAISFFVSSDLLSVYKDYFSQATCAVKSGLYDVIAHPDLIKKYTNDFTIPVTFSAYRAEVEGFVEALAVNEVGLEVNTKGLTLPVKEAYPSDDLLNLYLSAIQQRNMNPIITIGSDAHKVDEVGYRISETLIHLYDVGVHFCTSFKSREKYDFEFIQN